MKSLLLLLFAPEYLKRMPKDDNLLYEAGAFTHYLFHQNPPEKMIVRGRRDAYKVARWLALKLDWSFCSPSLGIRWYLEEIKENKGTIKTGDFSGLD
jgi:hypothetical protein